MYSLKNARKLQRWSTDSLNSKKIGEYNDFDDGLIRTNSGFYLPDLIKACQAMKCLCFNKNEAQKSDNVRL